MMRGLDPDSVKFLGRKTGNSAIFESKKRIYIYVEGIDDIIFWESILLEHKEIKSKLRFLRPSQEGAVKKDGKQALKKVLKQATENYELGHSLCPVLGFADRDLDPDDHQLENLFFYDGWDREGMLVSLGLLNKVLCTYIDINHFDSVEKLSRSIRRSAEELGVLRKRLPTFHNWKHQPSLNSIIQRESFKCYQHLHLSWSYIKTIPLCRDESEQNYWATLVQDVTKDLEEKMLTNEDERVWDCRGHDVCKVTALVLTHGDWTFDKKVYTQKDIEQSLIQSTTLQHLKKTKFWHTVSEWSKRNGILWHQIFGAEI